MGFRGRNNLVGIQIWPNTLRRYAKQVQRHQGHPNSWKRSIVVFALTFSEALRFKLIKLDAIHVFEHGYDITIDYVMKYAYIGISPHVVGLHGGNGGDGGGRENFIEDLDDLQSFPPLQGS
ncbi:NAC domain-containing protein 67-like protein [Tanacetum coccineum]